MGGTEDPDVKKLLTRIAVSLQRLALMEEYRMLYTWPRADQWVRLRLSAIEQQLWPNPPDVSLHKRKE